MAIFRRTVRVTFQGDTFDMPWSWTPDKVVQFLEVWIFEKGKPRSGTQEFVDAAVAAFKPQSVEIDLVPRVGMGGGVQHSKRVT